MTPPRQAPTGEGTHETVAPFFWLGRRWWAVPSMPRSVSVSMSCLGMVGIAAALLGVIGVGVVLFTDAEVERVPPAVLIPGCVVVAAGSVLAMLRLRAGARSGWVLGLVLQCFAVAVFVWDSATSRSGRLPLAAVWPSAGVVALLWPASRRYVGIGRPAP